ICIHLIFSLCIDDESNIWVAAKGGLFKFDRDGKKVLFERKNPFPKKISPYCQVLYCRGKIIFAFADDKAALTELRILNLSGEILSEQFIDGKVQSLTISNNGKFFITKQLQGEDSIIYMSHIDRPINWEEMISEDEFVFQAICAVDSNTLLAATCTIPVNMYSNKQKIIKTFCESGKENGQIYFPRSIQRYKDGVLVLDKTGRIQRFNLDGKFISISAQIDAYLGNGFIVEEDQAIIACSGIVLDKDNKTICDDWLEKIKLDGSKWTPADLKS
ncbi:unnamed protein product, partial [Dracunculus medinensis]|uniref:Two component regulator propeller n=1 Tax=Dracunculus medinensis TaxID=318479 RepID=A0A0N4U0K3_DRAME